MWNFRLGAFLLATVLAGSFGPSARAGVDPSDPGLPQGWSQTAGKGYEAIVIGSANPVYAKGDPRRLNHGNTWGSALCVECHSANPSVYTANPVSMPVGDTSATYYGTHFVRNWQTAAGDPPYLTSGAKQTAHEKITYWAPGGQSNKGLSRYGTGSAYSGKTDHDSVLASSATQSTRGSMICESCHNMLLNEGSSLLLGTYNTTNGLASFCEDCHVTAAGGPPAHHPVTGHTVGADGDAAAAHPLNITHYSHLKDPLAALSATGGVSYYSLGMTCMSCHSPHDAAAATGARILRRGSLSSTDPLLTGKQVNVAYAANVPEAGVVKGQILSRIANRDNQVSGLARQEDMTAPKKLVTNFDPLCTVCH